MDEALRKVSYFDSSESGVAFFILRVANCGARGSVVVKELCYKPEGRGFKIA
jgi:hypothetical protein